MFSNETLHHRKCHLQDSNNEAEGRGIRTPVRAAQAEARDACGRGMDLLSGIRRNDRMGCSLVHFNGHAVLVGSTHVRFMDLS